MKATNSANLMASLAGMPARQLNLLLGGVLAVVLALLWTFALRAPLAALRAQQAEVARTAPAVNPAASALQLPALEARVAALTASVGAPTGATIGAMQLGLIGGVERAATRHGVVLRSAAPGPERIVATFSEVAIDVEAAGSYQALVAWLSEIESGAGALSVVSFELRAGDSPQQRIIKIRLAAYQAPKEQT